MTRMPQDAPAEPSDLQRRLGENLKAARQKAGLSQRDLGAATDMSQGLIGAIERGEQNVTLKTLGRLSKAIGANEQALLFGAEPFASGLTYSQSERVAGAVHAKLQAMVALKGSEAITLEGLDELLERARDEVRDLLGTALPAVENKP